jgi:hypothetical protein
MGRSRSSLHAGLVAALFAAGAIAFGAGEAAAEQFRVVTAVPGKMRPGTTAFIDTRRGPRIVEIDAGGKTVWQCSLAGSEFKSGEIHRGADLDWIGADDSFLVAMPFSGIFRVNRKCAVTWRYRTSKISHDADLLAHGTVLFTFGWDSTADPQATEIDPSGKIVWSWHAKGHVDPAQAAKGRRRGGGGGGGGRRGGRDEGFTHANSVVRLANGDTLVSLRNFHRVAQVGPDGSVRRFYEPIARVHDPSLLPDGTLVAASHSPMEVVAVGGGSRRTIFANEIGIKPIRTVEQLKGGGFLLTGGEDIVEIDGAGSVVWRVRVYSGLGQQIRRGVYKAVRVAK